MVEFCRPRKRWLIVDREVDEGTHIYRLQDALSSLTTQVKESNLPGYVEAHEDVDLSATSPFLTKDSFHADIRNEYINASDLKAL
ncbi:hypothetical protein E4U59_000565 [Claviceps monticola]|nr:hypothetical protein E4U59_000565 [Claviceps monticola]